MKTLFFNQQQKVAENLILWGKVKGALIGLCYLYRKIGPKTRVWGWEGSRWWQECWKQPQSPKEASGRELSGAPLFGRRRACVTALLLANPNQRWAVYVLPLLRANC